MFTTVAFCLNFTTLWANSADDALIIFFLDLFFPENRIWHVMQIVSYCMKCEILLWK